MNTKWFSSILMAVVVGIVLTIAAPGTAAAAFTKTTCDVTNADWLMYPSSGGLTLVRALYHASKIGDRDLEHCTNQINIKVKKINLTSQAYIKGNGTGEGDRFVIEGQSDGADGITILDAAAVGATSPEVKCVVRVVGQYVTLKNIRVSNVPQGWNAVCIEKQNAIIDKFEVMDGGGSGIVFNTATGEAINSVIKSTTSISGMIDSAIDFGDLGDNTFSLNSIEPVSEAVRATMGDTDANGTILVPADKRPGIGADGSFSRGEVLALASSDVSRFFKSTSKVQACIKSKMQSEDGDKIRVRGWVVSYDGTLPEGVLPEEAPVSTKVTGLQIYDKTGFYGFVGPWNDGAERGMGENQADAENTMLGHTGYFDFELDKNVGKVVLVPHESDGKVGRASTVIDVSAGVAKPSEAPCVEWEIGDVGGGGGTATGVVFRGFTSVADCKTKRATAFGGNIASYYDSDGDGVLDDEEDVNRNCDCESTESCWYKFDTDGDGIPDGAGQEKFSVDTDGDTVPNVLDDDSDGDGVGDGLEDRNQSFKKGVAGGQVDGLLYRYQSTFGLAPVQDIGGEHETLTCKLEGDSSIGVRYSWYVVTCSEKACATFSSNPRKITDFGAEAPPEGSNERLAVLVCRNRSLVSAANFDGARSEANLELDPWNVDTDKDGFCDGPKCGKENLTLKANDGCPLVYDTANACGQKIPCYSESIWYSVLPQFVKWDSNSGLPTGPVDEKNWAGEEEEDGIPDFLQQDFSKGPKGIRAAIEKNCPVDSDDDGIPDCVENPFAECAAQQTPGSDSASQKLKHYMADSDGDGFIDGVAGAEKSDVCPESKGADDGFAEGKTAYSCDPAKIYDTEILKVLSCFIDRDGDGLRDCDEDLNMNGEYNASNIAADTAIDEALISTIETKALMADTDDDGLSDYVERTQAVGSTGRFTHPQLVDTDSDGFMDGAENRDGKEGFDVGIKDGGGCSGLLQLDTDPTMADTDDDGLDDGLELKATGSVPNEAAFAQMILDEAMIRAGIDLMSNPRSKDSDLDGVSDGQEYDGKVYFKDSNPCMADSDMDGIQDATEYVGCALVSDDVTPNCNNASGMQMKDRPVGGGGEEGWGGSTDSDSDGLGDSCEGILGTNSQVKDSDGDGIFDGDEVDRVNCTFSMGTPNPNPTPVKPNPFGSEGRWEYQTNPMDADTDDDGLRDDMEYKYDTDPTIADTDNDCIPDGLEDANSNGKWDASETNAIEVDTDGDGLVDGNFSGVGEDLNCDGMRNQDENFAWLETDPTNPDSDFDGQSDFTEMMEGGWNPMANVARATTGAGEGCSLAGGNAAPTSMIWLLGMLLAATKTLGRRMRKEGMK